MTSHLIHACGVTFGYRPRQAVLHGVDLTAAAGRFLCILGPNGSGKSTLLRCLLGQLRPQRGSIVIDGKALHKYSARNLAKLLAYVPQFPQSAFAFNVREIVLMGRFAHAGALGMAARQDVAVAQLAMEMTDTQAFADRTLEELSGGEAQRVMIARALAQQPSVMLLDEPTSHLDIKAQLHIYRMMQRLAHDWQMAVICVSHDINMASHFADELVLMRGGCVLAAGAPADVVQKDILQAVYDVNIDLIASPGDAVPMIRAM